MVYNCIIYVVCLNNKNVNNYSYGTMGVTLSVACSWINKMGSLAHSYLLIDVTETWAISMKL